MDEPSGDRPMPARLGLANELDDARVREVADVDVAGVKQRRNSVRSSRARKRKRKMGEKNVRRDGDNAKAPKDRFYLAYFVFILLGVGTLLPWNAFITAYDYFSVAFGENIEFFLGIAYMWPNLLCLFPLIKFGPRFPFSLRIQLGLGTMGACLLATLLIIAIQPAQAVGFALLIVVVVISGAASALLQGSVFGLASLFPPYFVSGVMGGQGIAGFGICVIRMVTKVSFPSTEKGNRISSVVYFAVAVCTVIFAMIAFAWFVLTPICRYYLRISKVAAKQNRRLSAPGSPEERSEQAEMVARDTPDAGAAPEVRQLLDKDDDTEGSGDRAGHSGDEEDEVLEREVEVDGGADVASHRVPVAVAPVDSKDVTSSPAGAVRRRRCRSFRIFWKISIMCFNVAFCFFVTLALFPGVTSLIPAEEVSEDWFVIIMITIFNGLDTMGRNLPRWFVGIKPNMLWIFALVRMLFFPLFVFCINPHIFKSDYIAYAIMVVFAFSNGFFSSLAMMFAPGTKGVQQDEKEMVGIWMTIFLNVGLTSGVTFGILVKLFVEQI